MFLDGGGKACQHVDLHQMVTFSSACNHFNAWRSSTIFPFAHIYKDCISGHFAASFVYYKNMNTTNFRCWMMNASKNLENFYMKIYSISVLHRWPQLSQVCWNSAKKIRSLSSHWKLRLDNKGWANLKLNWDHSCLRLSKCDVQNVYDTILLIKVRILMSQHDCYQHLRDHCDCA